MDMKKAEKTYTTFNKVRLSLFVRTYACCVLSQYLKRKYKIDPRLKGKDLRMKFFNRHAIPEISRLSRALNFSYSLLWEAVILDKRQAIPKDISDIQKIKIYLSIENELSLLAVSKWTRSKDFFDPDYEDQPAVLSIAIERAVGNFVLRLIT